MQNDVFNEDLSELALGAERQGWELALYEYAQNKVVKGESLPEDQRSADWKWFLPLGPDSVVLVVGSGLGAIPMALASTCKEVHVVDADENKIRFLTVYKTQQKQTNIFPLVFNGVDGLPYAPKMFDAVVFYGVSNETGSFQRAACVLNRLLKSGASACFLVENRFAIQGLFSKDGRKGQVDQHSLSAYRGILKTSGFFDIQAFAPLPHVDGIPLFYLPLDQAGVMAYFFSHIFPLFEMVSPEVKRQYGIQYLIAKAAVRCLVFFRITGVAKHFFSGYLLVATSKAKKA